jgi:hypothetical protein
MGVSEMVPGASTDLGQSPVEKHYVVLEGEVTVIAMMPDHEQEEVVLRRWDSCRLAPGEARQLVNRSAARAFILLAMPFARP